jgi:hypothetical protein
VCQRKDTTVLPPSQSSDLDCGVANLNVISCGHPALQPAEEGLHVTRAAQQRSSAQQATTRPWPNGGDRLAQQRGGREWQRKLASGGALSTQEACSHQVDVRFPNMVGGNETGTAASGVVSRPNGPLHSKVHKVESRGVATAERLLGPGHREDGRGFGTFFRVSPNPLWEKPQTGSQRHSE